MIEHTRWVLESTRSPEEVRSALVDFGPRRTEIWRETSHPDVYRVHEVGPTWADVTEGVPYAWSRERYDWSVPGRVTLDQTASNVARPGGRIQYDITPTAQGCRVACTRTRRFRTSPRGLLAGSFMRLAGSWILRRQFEAALRRLD